ncbi:DUF6171 family protein [Streptococcus plurextorum]|uniref:DUF6171 family protein n=1 Tax=Streptococcus plurextorum TaxID=456876 RepID=UPI0024806F45|nr:DUF6171 family protein [Streptococcus plurextorum]
MIVLRICYGCDIKEEMTNLDIESSIAFQLAMEIDRVNEKEWLRRRQICEQCPWRIGATCGKCGCFYQFRTALNNKKCPDGKW